MSKANGTQSKDLVVVPQCLLYIIYPANTRCKILRLRYASLRMTLWKQKRNPFTRFL